MNAISIRRALRALLPGSAVARRPLVVQHLGFESTQLDTLPAVLDDVGRELGLEIRLDGLAGDVVLAEQRFLTQVPPQALQAFLEERPMVTVALSAAAEGDARRLALQLHAEVVRQLRLLTDAVVAGGRHIPLEQQSTLPPNSGFDSNFDSRQHVELLAEAELDPDRAQLLNRLRRGLVDPTQPVLTAGYGPQAILAVDFSTGMALIDELADQHLRVTRDMPYLAPRSSPGPLAKQRDLDLVVWDIAVAAGGFRLLHSPVTWWHAPLIARPHLNVARFTSLPRHLELARCLAVAPISPAELRRRCRVSLTELRGFLQACLFLGLVYWVPSTRG